jgi:hypothetical protein
MTTLDQPDKLKSLIENWAWFKFLFRYAVTHVICHISNVKQEL